MRECDLYQPISKWLCNFLHRKYRAAHFVRAEDTSRSSVANFLQRHQLTAYVPWGATLDIAVDVTGVALLVTRDGKKILKLAIVEVKNHPINLRDLSQVLGYAKVILPDHAFIVSPNGYSSNLQRLLRDFGRKDILEYAPNRSIVIARWDIASGSIRPGEILSV